jgi:regulation of enolase protein 1 (concanavalin A-like superfamily)
MEVPGTAHDFAAELKRWNAPRVLTEIEGDFMLTVELRGKFQPAAPSTIVGRRPYHGAGLLLVQDAQNHLSLQRGSVLLGKQVRHYANFELRHGLEGTKVSNFEFDIEDRDVSLRVARRSNRIVAMTSQDGVNWRAFKPMVVDFPQTLKVGIEAISSSETPLSCSFHGLAIYRE